MTTKREYLRELLEAKRHAEQHLSAEDQYLSGALRRSLRAAMSGSFQMFGRHWKALNDGYALIDAHPELKPRVRRLKKAMKDQNMPGVIDELNVLIKIVEGYLIR